MPLTHPSLKRKGLLKTETEKQKFYNYTEPCSENSRFACSLAVNGLQCHHRSKPISLTQTFIEVN